MRVEENKVLTGLWKINASFLSFVRGGGKEHKQESQIQKPWVVRKLFLSISSTIYTHFFRTKVLLSAFLYLQFMLVFSWWKNIIGEKAARKMLTKLNPRATYLENGRFDKCDCYSLICFLMFHKSSIWSPCFKIFLDATSVARSIKRVFNKLY